VLQFAMFKVSFVCFYGDVFSGDDRQMMLIVHFVLVSDRDWLREYSWSISTLDQGRQTWL